MRSFAQQNWIPLLTSTHLVEFLIRECSLVSTITERGEGLKSALLLLWSLLMEPVRQLVTEWRGNVQKIKGNIKNKAVIAVALKLYAKYEETVKEEEAYKSIFESFCERTNRSKEEGQSKLLTSFTEASTKPPNQRQKATGVQRSPIIDGRVLFKDLVPFDKYRNAVVEEIQARQADYTPSVTKPTQKELRRKLVEVLMASGECKEGEKLSFRPRSAYFVRYMNENGASVSLEAAENTGGASNAVEGSSDRIELEINT